MKIYELYHRDRAYAASLGDPALALLQAEDRDEALLLGSQLGLDAVGGLWAVRVEWDEE